MRANLNEYQWHRWFACLVGVDRAKRYQRMSGHSWAFLGLPAAWKCEVMPWKIVDHWGIQRRMGGERGNPIVAIWPYDEAHKKVAAEEAERLNRVTGTDIHRLVYCQGVEET